MRKVKRYELALRELADQGCGHVYQGMGDCVRMYSNKIHDRTNGWADSWCDPCIAYAALHPREVAHD